MSSTHFGFETVDEAAKAGKVRGVSRSIQVLVSRGGSTQFLYYTDFEDADPANTQVYPSGAPSNACGKSGPTLAQYYWQNSSRGCTDCPPSQIRGPSCRQAFGSRYTSSNE